MRPVFSEASLISSCNSISDRATETPAFSMINSSSLDLRRGIVVTQIPPAFKTANQQATSMGVFPDRSRTLPPV